MIQKLESCVQGGLCYLVFFKMIGLRKKNFNIFNSIYPILLRKKITKLNKYFFFKKNTYLVQIGNMYNRFVVLSIHNNHVTKISSLNTSTFKKSTSVFHLNFIIEKYKTFFIKVEELELKGINYRFCKLKSNLLLDLGCSHFQLFYYPINYFFLFLKKKKFKRIFFLNFNKYYFSSAISFFRYKLKSVGPYKLKGFQFINERVVLKQGKKPFK